jgi:hypothetical protein
MGVHLFPLGRLVGTPAVLRAFSRTGENPIDYVLRHRRLDPGVLGANDQVANRRAVEHGGRILSAYLLADGTRIWIITEADRSATTVLLPGEY